MINRDLIKLFILLLTVFLLSEVKAQNIGINAGGSAPDLSAGLDVDFSNKGLLIPRVALTSTTDVTTIASPATSLLVYNTATAGTSPNDVTPGYYYYNGSAWVKFATSSGPANDWSLTGNVGTDSLINFIGTTDFKPIIFRSNNKKYIKLNTSGFFGLSTMKPRMNMDVMTDSSGSKYGVLFHSKIQKRLYNNTYAYNSGYQSELCAVYSVYSSTFKGKTLFLWRPDGALRIGTFDSTTIFNDLPQNSVAIGYNCNAFKNGFAIGNYAYSGANSFAFGFGAKADSSSIALGRSTAIGNSSISLGGYASGSGSISIGENMASGKNSAVFGNYSTASGQNSMVFGINCYSSANNAFIIGSGANDYCDLSSSDDRLKNNTGNSLAVGFNSDIPTLFVGTSSGLGTTGNVGIGTSSPSEKLHVNGKTRTSSLQVSTGASNGFVLTSDASGNATWQSLPSISGSAWSLTGNTGTSAVTNFIGTTDAVDFVTRTSNTERMRITSAGNVGIGTVAPPAKLTVSGTASNPAIPNSSSSAIFRVALGNAEGIDFGKAGAGGNYAGWIQAGYNGTTADPLALQVSGGNVGIGTTNPSQKLHVTGNGLFTGTVTASCGVLACSDIRYKENIQTIENPIEKINAISGVTYDWKVNEFPEKGFTDQKQIGFIAQELEKVLPEMVHTDENGFKTVDYAKATPVLVEAMKEQQHQIDMLKEQYTELLKEMQAMKSMLESNQTTQK